MYLIDARNAFIGIYSKKEKAFTISRHKFGRNYLFDEYHWDIGAPFGTVHPLKEVGQAPKFKSDNRKLVWLNIKSIGFKRESLTLNWERNPITQRLYKDAESYIEDYR